MEENTCGFIIEHCNFEAKGHLTIPELVSEISKDAFKLCNQLQSIRIPSSVKHIEQGAFEGCEQLEYFVVDPENENYYSNDGILFQKHPFILLCYPATKSSNTYSVPQGVESIGKSAFARNTHLNLIELPSSLKTVQENAFFQCINLTEISFPTTVEYIGSNAFGFCTNLRNVSLPEGLTAINESLFFGCASLKEIQIPTSVKLIDFQAFSGCVALERLFLPDKVEFISPFNLSCPNLQEIEVSPKNQSYCVVDGALYTHDMSVLVGVLPTYEKACFVVPETVLVLDELAFNSCHNITKIVLPPKLKQIGIGAFSDCINLKQINIPKDVEFIGVSDHLELADDEMCSSSLTDVFSGCLALERIDVDESNAWFCSRDGVLFTKDLSTILCFPSGKPVSNYRIPAGVTCIGNSSFSGCTNLKTVSIPDTVTTIENWAFAQCTLLEPVQIPSTVKNVFEFAFWNDFSDL